MAMTGSAQREARRSVSLPASLRGEGPVCDVTIRNHSARGLTIVVHDAPPPRRGSFVDIRRGTLMMAGQVRWRAGDRIGVRLQDPVDLASLSDGRVGRVAHRPPLAASMTVRPAAERSRSIGSALQYATLALVPFAMIAMAGWILWDRAAEPLRLLHAALG
jgi:hypothetical protein